MQDDENKRPRTQAINSELFLSKEQLFDMFQQILGVKKFEHQLLYNALLVRIVLSSGGSCIFESENQMIQLLFVH